MNFLSKGNAMATETKKIAVTGSAGQIAYNLLFRIANGDLFGPNQPVGLHLLDLPETKPVLEAVKMELEDCDFPLLSYILISSNAYEAFKDVHYALLIGAKPRGPGMERKDLLLDNGKIFVEQGNALNETADPNAKILVVGNPCNTNCLIAMTHAERLPKKNFFALTRLDQNRATHFLAQKAGVPKSELTRVTIWGNHSATQVPDYFHACISGKPVPEVIKDHGWLQNDFLQLVQQRGAKIIQARGKSSAASAASAIIDSVKDLNRPTPPQNWFSVAIHSKGNSYGIDQNLLFSFPCRLNGNGERQIVNDLSFNPELEKLIKITEKELQEEREMIKHLLEKQSIHSR